MLPALETRQQSVLGQTSQALETRQQSVLIQSSEVCVSLCVLVLKFWRWLRATVG
jgi:hypothetical protein